MRFGWRLGVDFAGTGCSQAVAEVAVTAARFVRSPPRLGWTEGCSPRASRSVHVCLNGGEGMTRLSACGAACRKTP